MEFGSEGMESEEVSKLPLEEAEVSEQSLDWVLDEGSEWREHAVVLGMEGAWNQKYSKVSLELGGGWSLKNAKGVRGRSWKNSKMFLEWRTGHPQMGDQTVVVQ